MIAYEHYMGTIDSHSIAGCESDYYSSGYFIRVGSIFLAKNVSETKSVSTLAPPEQELNPYDCLRLNGGLQFWDKPEEDIYNFEDGHPA